MTSIQSTPAPHYILIKVPQDIDLPVHDNQILDLNMVAADRAKPEDRRISPINTKSRYISLQTRVPKIHLRTIFGGIRRFMTTNTSIRWFPLEDPNGKGWGFLLWLREYDESKKEAS
jgi:hypothetical protein